MSMFTSLKNYIDAWDQKEFRNYTTIAFGIVLLLLASILFLYYRNVSYIRSRTAAINKQRLAVRELVSRYDLVKKQQVGVDAILAKEKDFKISQYFEQLLQKLGLTANKTQDVETMSEEVLDGYTEWTLYAHLTNMNTKKMSELLHAIELEERIYTKEVEVERSTTNPNALNVKLTIATLEPKVEAAKETEG
jgi:hypothetical protein